MSSSNGSRISGYKDVERLRSSSQKSAVLDSTPASLLHSLNVMGRQKASQALGHALVKQQAHRRPKGRGHARVRKAPGPP